MDHAEKVEDAWICGLCGDVQEYDSGEFVWVPETPTHKYACVYCLEDALLRGGRLLTVEELTQLGLRTEYQPEWTTAMCAACGTTDDIEAPLWFFEAVHDGLETMGWVFGADRAPYCPDCAELAPTTPPRRFDIFGEDRMAPQKRAPETKRA